VTVAYLVSSIGCTAARIRPSASAESASLQRTAAEVPGSGALSYAETQRNVALASYDSSVANQPILTATPDDLASSNVDLEQIVRGQDDHGYGPIREFLWSPYTIGAIFVAALVIPAAFKGAEDEF
jgi:hypothetical protein